MKKLIALLLAVMMVLSMAACGEKKEEGTKPVYEDDLPPTTEERPSDELLNTPENALDVLNDIWALYGDDDKFPVMGGNPEGNVMDGPAVYDKAYIEGLTMYLVVPETSLNDIEEAATMIHMMNANNFTSGVIKVADGVDTKAFADTMHTAIQSNHWMCGMPERLVITSVSDGYVLIAFGVADAMTPFCEKLATAYPQQNTFYDEAITG